MRCIRPSLLNLGRDTCAEIRQLRRILCVRAAGCKRTHDRVLRQQSGGSDHTEPLCCQQVIQLDERILIRAAAVNRRGDHTRPAALARPQPF